MQVILTIDFKAPWRCGVGRGDFYIDAFVARDVYGLPVVPGRAVKGVLRDALVEAVADGVASDDAVTRWFGSRGAPANKRAYQTKSGELHFDDARIDVETRAWFEVDPDGADRRDARALLFDEVESTAIAELGAARTGTLRRLEVTVPLTLSAAIDGPAVAGGDEDWRAVLALGLPYVVGFGAGRTRGFGRCALSLSCGGPNE